MHEPPVIQVESDEKGYMLSELAWMVHWVGFALIGYSLLGILYQAWPVALLQPAWLQKTGQNLSSNAMPVLLGAALVAVAPGVDPWSEILAKRANLLRRLASWAAIGYLLLIPVQIYSGVRLLREGQQKQAQLLRQGSQAVKAIQDSRTMAELSQAYGQIPGNKPTLPSQFPIPLEEARDRLVDQIRPRIKFAENELEKLRSTLWQDWFRQVSVSILQFLMLFLGFAAIGRKSPNQPTLLKSLLFRRPRAGGRGAMSGMLGRR